MNHKLISVGILGTVSFFAFSSGTMSAQPGQTASAFNIACNTQSNIPKVIANFSQAGKAQNSTIISFVPQHFSPQEALDNCKNTANILQSLYRGGNVRYLTNDKLNAQPVVCAVERRGVGCNHYSAKVLFTLNSEANSSQVLYDILGKDFKQKAPPDARTVSRIYSDIKPDWWPF